MVDPGPIERGHPEHFVVTRMGHNEMLAEVEQSGCQHLTSALIAKGATCVAKRRNGKSPTGQQGIGVRFLSLIHISEPTRPY